MKIGIAGIVATLAAVVGCDALVGGECIDGHIVLGGSCVPDTSNVVTDGGSAGFQPAGGGGAGGHPDGGGGGHPSGGSAGVGGGQGCPDGLTLCPEGCVDLQSNVRNCGSCGYVCPTEVCVDGMCVGDPVGHVVVLGMNYVESTAAARRVLGNAAFLPIHNPVRIMTHDTYGDDDSIEAVDEIIGEQGAIRNRQAQLTSATTAGVVGIDVEAFDILLIHDQVDAPRDWAAGFAAQTANAIDNFTQAGGTIIVLATVDEMASFVTELGAVHITGIAPLLSPNLSNNAPTDVLGVAVQSPMLAKPITNVLLVGDAPDPTLSFVLAEQDAPDRPVVIHRAVIGSDP